MKIRLIGGPKDGETIDAPETFSRKLETSDDWLTYRLDRVNGEFIATFEEE
jgi:hypothetical protein